MQYYDHTRFPKVALARLRGLPLYRERAGRGERL